MPEDRIPKPPNGQLDLLDQFKPSMTPPSSDSMALDLSNSQIENKTSEQYKSPKSILFIDTETTGLDPQRDFCIEVGAILFHVPSRNVLAQHSFLVPVDTNNAQPINRIPAEVSRVSQPFKEAINYLSLLIDASEVVVAHNAAFDSQWFGREPLPRIVKPWLCSMDDISWPKDKQISSRPSVRELALAYGVPVWNAHRALTDCIYLAEVFQRCDNLEILLCEGLEPRRLMRAHISYDDRHKAKEAGFRWNDPIKGAWSRRLSDREAEKLCFKVSPVDSL